MRHNKFHWWENGLWKTNWKPEIISWYGTDARISVNILTAIFHDTSIN